jgi:hypothetical protein
MHVNRIVRQLLAACSDIVHAKRITAVLVAVDAIVRGGRLALTSIGRSIAGPVRPKHSIKRIDRLLGNGKLFLEVPTFFKALARWLLRDEERPVVLVDWTLVVGSFRALYAAVPIGGRAVTIYLEVHPERLLGNTRVQQRFLARLRDVLPPGCRPIIVTDAGFHGAFFREIYRLGWDFVGRLRGTAKARPASGGEAISKEQFYAKADAVPRDAGRGLFDLYTNAESVLVRLVSVRKKRAARRRQLPARKPDREFLQSAHDPWLLATSIIHLSPAAIVNIYAKRMQIEETFRDTKNHRFGWSLRHVRSHSCQRLQVQLMLAAVATLAVTILGYAAERQGVHRGYQANTVAGRVLSFFVLGCSLVQRGDHRQFLRRGGLTEATHALRLGFSRFENAEESQ